MTVAFIPQLIGLIFINTHSFTKVLSHYKLCNKNFYNTFNCNNITYEQTGDLQVLLHKGQEAIKILLLNI